MSHIIIGIHGLSNKPAPELLEAGCESATIEGLEKNLQIHDASINFLSVNWADRLHDKYDENPDLYKPAEAVAIKTYENSWLHAVREKSFDWVGDIIESARNNFGMDGLVANERGGIQHKSCGYLRTPEVSRVINNFI